MGELSRAEELSMEADGVAQAESEGMMLQAAVGTIGEDW